MAGAGILCDSQFMEQFGMDIYQLLPVAEH